MVELKAKLIRWMKSPEELTWEDVLLLENLEKEHPYFQTIKPLIAKHYLEHNHISKTKKINTASTYSLNRNTLRNFLNLKQNKITADPFTSDEKEKTGLKGSEPEETVATISVEKQTIKTTPAETEANLELEDSIVKLESLKQETPIEQTPEKEDTVTGSSLVIAQDLEETETTKTEVSNTTLTRENERKELLTAINKRLEELKEKKESYLAEVKQELKKSDKNLDTQEDEHTIKPISFDKLLGNKEHDIKRTSTESINDDPVESLKENKEEEVKDFPLPEPSKDVFYSRLGGVLTSKTEDDIDNLLNYIKQKKESNSLTIKPKEDIISKFIKEDPRISKLKKSANEPQQDLTKNVKPVELVSENLARIHEKQGNTKKAISIYQKLILKFPEKKMYFASRIEKLKNK